MRIFRLTKRKKGKVDFEETFDDLIRMGLTVKSASRTYKLLKNLDFQTPKTVSDTLIFELNKINYSSNTNSYFYFYFPIVSHILYYKPDYVIDILRYLVGPNFANGSETTEDMIKVIQGAMRYKLSENKKFLTMESQNWVLNELPKLTAEIDREIKICWKELED